MTDSSAATAEPDAPLAPLPVEIRLLQDRLSRLSRTLIFQDHWPVNLQHDLLPLLREVDDLPTEIDLLERNPALVPWVHKLRLREECAEVKQAVDAMEERLSSPASEETWGTRLRSLLGFPATRPRPSAQGAATGPVHPYQATTDDSTLETLSDKCVPSFTSAIGLLAVGTFVALLFVKPQRPR